MRSVLVYIAIYFGVFIVLHRMFRRWWYGAVGPVIAMILTLWSQLLAVGLCAEGCADYGGGARARC